MRINYYLLAVVLGGFAGSAPSADFDGGKPLICSAIEANDCAPGVNCLKGLAEDVNVPQFIRLNFSDKTISARGRTTVIQNHSRGNGMLVVQGFENGRAWSITISETNGKLVGAIAGDEEGFLIFGACTPM